MISNFKDEWLIRIVFFLATGIILFICEKIFPRFDITALKRKIINLSLHLVNVLVIRLVFPGAAVAIALFSEKTSMGLLHHYPVNHTAAVVATVLILEGAVYFQHLLFHKIPFLWRLHRIHHSDTSVDFTTALRFHPLEIFLSMFYKGLFILFLGFPVTGVIVFEVLLNTMAMFNHGNMRLPEKLEKYLRMIIVTPNMHRIHHSLHEKDHNTNFSFSLSIWDRFV